MILFLTVDAKRHRQDAFYDAIWAAFPDPARVHYCGETDGQRGYLFLKLGLCFEDLGPEVAPREHDLPATLSDLYEHLGFGRVTAPSVPLGMSLGCYAVEVEDFKQGGATIAALLKLDPEIVVGFEYKAGSIEPVPVRDGLPIETRGDLSFKGGFPSVPTTGAQTSESTNEG